jgi:hypothetical protein
MGIYCDRYSDCCYSLLWTDVVRGDKITLDKRFGQRYDYCAVRETSANFNQVH